MHSKIINVRYEIGEIVYLKTDKEQTPRIIYSYKVFEKETMYETACGTQVSLHYEFEITKDANVLMTTTN